MPTKTKRAKTQRDLPRSMPLERWKLFLGRYPDGALNGSPYITSGRDGRTVAMGFKTERSVEDMALIAHVPELLSVARIAAILRKSDAYNMFPAVRMVADSANEHLQAIANAQAAALDGKEH